MASPILEAGGPTEVYNHLASLTFTNINDFLLSSTYYSRIWHKILVVNTNILNRWAI